MLVDTSVWRRYFGGGTNVRHLGGLLDEDGAPFVLGAMVQGGLSVREEALLLRLPSTGVVPHEEVLAFVRRLGLTRRGIGRVDVHLLASALISRASLWPLDSKLTAAAAERGVSFDGSH